VKLITDCRELKDGKKYYCRDKRPASDGTKKITTFRVEFNEGRRRLGPLWAYDAVDQILTQEGWLRIKAVQDVHGEDYNVAVYPTDYEQRLEAFIAWDIIGPVPEFDEAAINDLFDQAVSLEHTREQVPTETQNPRLLIKLEPGDVYWLTNDFRFNTFNARTRPVLQQKIIVGENESGKRYYQWGNVQFTEVDTEEENRLLRESFDTVPFPPYNQAIVVT